MDDKLPDFPLREMKVSNQEKRPAIVANKKLRAETAAIVRSIRERFQDYSADEIESLVEDAIRETREKRV